ncbi:hypothetical protein N8Z44_00105 [Planktomarina temperata]|nr:hypothetical protein [Planktomarina temperata]MDC1233308.1 hypothetical protein [Planktomarina temperata]
MSDTGTGLMQPQTERNTTQRSEMLDAFRDALAPLGGSQTLEDKLQALTPSQRDMLLSTAKMVKMAMAGKVAAGDYSMGYADLVAQMYGRMDLAKRQLIIELLDETAPLEFVPQRKRSSQADTAISFYDRPEMQIASEEPQQMNSDFLERLSQSESNGDSNAEITIADGRRYVGSLQFGDARLQDYKKATGSSFTQDEFKANSALQDRVAAWHIADIDKTIDGLGLNTDGYDRDGLRAVAHLGGKGGMKKFVRSNGEYNPSDELGTSLQDYYDKFAVQS